MNLYRLTACCGLLAALTACGGNSASTSPGLPAATLPELARTGASPAQKSTAPILKFTPTLARELQQARVKDAIARREPYVASDNGTHLWLADERGALWETAASTTAAGTGKKIVGALYDCASPLAVKTDHAGNLWAACESTGTINMYAPKAKKATLVLQEDVTSGSSQTRTVPDDIAFDASGNVYVANAFTETESASNLTFTNANVAVFLAKCNGLPCNKATPDSIIIDPNANPKCPKQGNCEHGIGNTFIDVDANGSLYQGFNISVSECLNSCKIIKAASGLDRIDLPLSSTPTYTALVRKMVAPGGVYVTGNGRVLNLLDAGTGIMKQYQLFPFTKWATFGPLPQSHFKDCDSWSLAFNRAETLVASTQLSCYDAVVGQVPQNTFNAQTNINYGELAGAAFQPSDK